MKDMHGSELEIGDWVKFRSDGLMTGIGSVRSFLHKGMEIKPIGPNWPGNGNVTRYRLAVSKMTDSEAALCVLENS